MVDLSDLSAEEFEVNKSTKAIGHSKDYYQNNLLLQQDYLNQSYKYFNKDSYIAMSAIKNKKDRPADRKYTEYKLEKKKEQAENMEDVAKRDVSYTIANYKDYEFTSLGRLDENDLVLKENFTIDKDFLKRAGPNYLVPIGQLIEDQVAIKEDEIERSKNIYMAFARSFNNDITVMLPEGYTIDGLEKLNINVSNSTGGFTSKATLEDQKLIIKTKKWYEHLYEPKEKWPEMIAFLEGAFQFSQQKVLLKKK